MVSGSERGKNSYEQKNRFLFVFKIVPDSLILTHGQSQNKTKGFVGAVKGSRHKFSGLFKTQLKLVGLWHKPVSTFS